MMRRFVKCPPIFKWTLNLREGFRAVGNVADEIPGKKIRNAIDGMISDAFQQLTKVELRIDSVQLRCTDEGVDGGGPFAAIVRSCKKVVLSAETDRTQGALRRVVVHLDCAVIDIAREGAPTSQGIANRY